MSECAFYMVDAFTAVPFTGNPCAVVLADGLKDADMARIARETNAPETAFVLPSDKADVRVRYFMPRGEIPFAGHPTIATGHLLREIGRLGVGTASFAFNIGILPVQIGTDNVTMTQPAAVPGVTADAPRTAQALGLDVSDLRAGLPCQVMRGGVSFLMVPVRRFAVLERIRMDRAALKAVLSEAGVAAAYVFAPEGLDAASDAHARLIDPDNPGEDPFTGSAAGCMASYLHACGLCSGGRIRLEQGHLLERPGYGTLDLVTASGEDGTGHLEAVRLSGTAVITGSGTLRW